MVANKLNEAQATTARLENKHEAIEHTVKGTPKTYADITKTTITDMNGKAIAETHIQQRQHRDALRQEQAKYEITLTMKETSDNVKELINTMAPKEITARCQQAIDKGSIQDVKLQGINKLTNGIRVRCETEEEAKQLRTIDWNEAFEGAKIHRPNYPIVIHGIPIDDLDLEESKTIETIEAANKFPNGIITKITPLRGKKNEPFSKYCSIVAYFSNYHMANKCITSGCCIKHVHYYGVRFTRSSR
jgi:hypothetical protein